ncbi:DUF3800 domain-containing protein [Sphingomonas aurantiaca]|nr:DUF3800 domain-containing protein [Sphingomonas aurantiaca]
MSIRLFIGHTLPDANNLHNRCTSVWRSAFLTYIGSMAAPLQIFCDESGQTGPNLLDAQQRIFTYAGVATTDDEAWSVISTARQTHGILDDELKASALLKTDAGRALVLDILRVYAGRYSIVAYDKALALSAKVFEYVYEPVFQHRPELLYAKDLHRFVAMYCYTFLINRDDLGGEAVRQFLAFMRSYDPATAPLLFGTHDERDPFEGNPFEMVTKFANGYRDVIIADNQSERDALRPGTLTLDLASSGLFSILCHFGKERRPLDVTCDEHPQLETISKTLVGGDDDPSIMRARRLNPQADISWTLAGRIRFDQSRNRPGLQVADLIAGAASTLASGRTTKRGMEAHLELVDLHINPHTMMPDYDAVRQKLRGPAVNWMVLYGLGEHAGRGENPHLVLRELYAESERRWDAGETPRAA